MPGMSGILNQYQISSKLLPRNEGKIKTFESCSDIRAWSHDCMLRSQYIKEWIRADMPVVIFSTEILSTFTRTMNSRVVPSCHPRCKSRVVLNSICTTCNKMKDCLKDEEYCEEYFRQEEFQTQNWPCESCAEVLRNLKNFWQIIADKIFNVKFSKSTEEPSIERTGNLKSAVNTWEKEMTHQTGIIKVIASKHKNIKKRDMYQDTRCTFDYSYSVPIKHNSHGDTMSSHSTKSEKRKENVRCDKTTSATVTGVDASCSSCDMDKREEVLQYKRNMNMLEQQFNQTQQELAQLKNENDLLRTELKCANENKSKGSEQNEKVLKINSLGSLTEPEYGLSNEPDAEPVESEMLITLKDAQDKNFEHISLLQIMHKSNRPQSLNYRQIPQKITDDDSIKLLKKVQDTFGAMFNKEIEIAYDKKKNPQMYNLETSFKKML